MAVTTELDDRVAPQAQAEAARTFGGDLGALATAAVEYYVETRRVIDDLLGRAEGGKSPAPPSLAQWVKALPAAATDPKLVADPPSFVKAITTGKAEIPPGIKQALAGTEAGTDLSAALAGKARLSPDVIEKLRGLVPGPDTELDQETRTAAALVHAGVNADTLDDMVASSGRIAQLVRKMEADTPG
jgi:hypothetical protein